MQQVKCDHIFLAAVCCFSFNDNINVNMIDLNLDVSDINLDMINTNLDVLDKCEV